MKKKLLSLLSLLMVLTMVMTSMVGCGDSGSNEVSNAAQTAENFICS